MYKNCFKITYFKTRVQINYNSFHRVHIVENRQIGKQKLGDV